MLCPLSLTSCNVSGYESGDALSMIRRAPFKKLLCIAGNKLRKTCKLHFPDLGQAACGMDKQGRLVRSLATTGSPAAMYSNALSGEVYLAEISGLDRLGRTPTSAADR